jgi:Catalase
MPLPADEKLIALSQDLLKQFDTIFGLHPGFRPAHARGVMLSGTLTPAVEASSLTRAPHILRDSTPVTARFSSSTGLPQIPDTDPNANPRGLAIRFHLAEHVHTDIVSHSTDGFPTRTGQEFLELLKAAASSDPSQPYSPAMKSISFWERCARTGSKRCSPLSITADCVWVKPCGCGQKTSIANAGYSALSMAKAARTARCQWPRK